jgi:hypothetical protein
MAKALFASFVLKYFVFDKFDFVKLRNSPLVSATFKFGAYKFVNNLFGKFECHHSPTHRQNICIVVRSRHFGQVKIVTQSSTHTVYFVGGYLFTLTAAAKHNAHIGFPVSHRASDICTDRWVVNTLR